MRTDLTSDDDYFYNLKFPITTKAKVLRTDDLHENYDSIIR